MISEQEARIELVQFLDKHPHLKKCQDDIDKALMGLDPTDRMSLLLEFIKYNLLDFRYALLDLVKLTRELK